MEEGEEVGKELCAALLSDRRQMSLSILTLSFMAFYPVAVHVLQLMLYSTFLTFGSGHVAIFLRLLVHGLANIVQRLQSRLIPYERHMILSF
jgi:hypothetical protein